MCVGGQDTHTILYHPFWISEKTNRGEFGKNETSRMKDVEKKVVDLIEGTSEVSLSIHLSGFLFHSFVVVLFLLVSSCTPCSFRLKKRWYLCFFFLAKQQKTTSERKKYESCHHTKKKLNLYKKTFFSFFFCFVPKKNEKTHWK